MDISGPLKSTHYVATVDKTDEPYQACTIGGDGCRYCSGTSSRSPALQLSRRLLSGWNISVERSCNPDKQALTLVQVPLLQ